jgi:hypothetical protein
MPNLLTTAQLIARMTPTALAEVIASIQQSDDIDATERQTVHVMRTVLACSVGDAEAAKLIAAASR